MAKLYRKGARVGISIRTGIVLVGSDGHYWPGSAPVAHRAFCKFHTDMQPQISVYNGDAFDGSKISRHAKIGWEKNPEVVEELEVCGVRLTEVQDAGGPDCIYVWNLGNHDMRFETFLANKIPEYAGVKGIHLRDHFPEWVPAWSCEIGGREGLFAKHRFKGGIHAARNNALNAGRTCVTSHRHAMQVTPVSDLNGTRWGVDVGMLGTSYGPQFTGYTEDNPVDWREGFMVFTFHKGRLLWPEPVHVISETEVTFRGQIITV